MKQKDSLGNRQTWKATLNMAGFLPCSGTKDVDRCLYLSLWGSAVSGGGEVGAGELGGGAILSIRPCGSLLEVSLGLELG